MTQSPPIVSDRTPLVGSSPGMNSSLRYYQITGLSTSSVEATSFSDAAYQAAGYHAPRALRTESVTLDSVAFTGGGAGKAHYTAQATAAGRTVQFSFSVSA
jgi:hypothetical protein